LTKIIEVKRTQKTTFTKLVETHSTGNNSRQSNTSRGKPHCNCTTVI